MTDTARMAIDIGVSALPAFFARRPRPTPVRLSSSRVCTQASRQFAAGQSSLGIELLQALAEVVQTRLSIRRFEKAALRAFTPAQLEVVACPAVARQRIAFCISERSLLFRKCQIAVVLVQNIAEPVLRIDKVIAAVQIAVVFKRQSLAADLAAHAFLRTAAEHLRDDVFELVNKNFAVVTAQPFVPDAAQKIAPVDQPQPAG